MNFTHLHVHSHYSLLDGLAKIPNLVAKAAAFDMKAIALTDHGALYGAMEFYKLAKKSGVKPIIGVEAYVAPRKLSSKQGAPDADYYHLILLAANREGYQNLMKLVTISNLEGYYYKPRIDKEVLARHSLGLIGLSACLRGEVSRSIASGNLPGAFAAASEYRQIFGQGNFFLEVQRTGAGDIQEQVNQGMLKVSTATDIPIIATGDVHYLDLEDRVAQDVMVCVGTGSLASDTDRLDMRKLSLHLASPSEMAKLFSDIPQAVTNSMIVADQVDIDLELGKRFFPSFSASNDQAPEDYLESLCAQGIAERYQGRPIPLEVNTRLKYELDVIKAKGYATYFLVVADFVNWSRKRGIICTTRGSAAGSLAAYALGITTMNPLEYKLPFERFLNPYRPSPPDIDMDFADDRRDEVLEYVSEKYGRNKVAQICTFGTMMARAAIRDVGRVLGIAYSKCDRIAKMIPMGKQGFHMTIDRALEISPDLKALYDTDGETRQILDLAKKLEGCVRHASVHAAGVVIAPTALTDYTPLQLDTDNRHIITQYDMHSVEDAGLVKMDFLGIRNLSILGNAVEIVKKTRGVQIDLQKIPLSDSKTYELLSRGQTMGVFQLGGSGMTRYLVDLKPSNIFDIMAMISLYRPGPMESIPEFITRKHNPAVVQYLDPRLREILDMSYGVITYQEDVLLTAITVAGYTWEEADKLRKAMGKKIPKEMAAQKEKFIDGAVAGGMEVAKAIKLWSLIEPFAAYGFGKAHAASYAIVAYQTAYMKANFPVEFMAAVLSAESGDNEKIAAAVAECLSLGIEVLPPDVNESLANFTVINEQQIRFGLAAIKNLGSDVIAVIITERVSAGQFLSLADFVRRIKTRNFNKKSWEALVKSGSLDRFGDRSQMLANTEMILEYAKTIQNLATAGQSTLFGGAGSVIVSEELFLKPAPSASESEKLSWEKELLGLYVSSHPLKDHTELLQNYCTPIQALSGAHDNLQCTVGGIITRVQNIITKKGEQMCFADLEDLGGSMELVVFPNTFTQHRALLLPEQIVLVRGKVSDKDGELKLLVDSIKSITDPELRSWASQNGTAPISNSIQSKVLKIKIPNAASPLIFTRLKDVFVKFPGTTQVSLLIPDREGVIREVKTSFAVRGDDEFKRQLRDLLRESVQQP